MRLADPVLLDVTRLVALRWTGRQANGIDRVCLEYLRHFRHRARAVVQHRGAIRVMGTDGSQRLFDLLGEQPAGRTRTKLAGHLAAAVAGTRLPPPDSVYLNVSHTDFDLPVHARWVARSVLRAVYLVHDLIPLTHPEHCRPHAIRRHAGRVRGALRHGSGIIVGSRAVERDLRDHAAMWRVAPPPVVMAPLAGARLPASAAATPAADGGYFLCVGTIESRKNHDLLLRVWERLRARLGDATPRLVVVGQWGRGVEALRGSLTASGMMDGLIQVVTRCDDAELARLMRGTRAMLMPSLVEGFGLPMAEALALGVPVIASDLPCFHEVGQGIPHLLDPTDVAAWEARIVALDAPAAARQRRIDALRGYRAPTWEDHFAQIDPWIARIAALPGRHDAATPAAPLPSPSFCSAPAGGDPYLET